MNSPTDPPGRSSPVSRPIVSRHDSRVRSADSAAEWSRFRRAVLPIAFASAINSSTRAGSLPVALSCTSWCAATFSTIAGMQFLKCLANDQGVVPGCSFAIARSDRPSTCACSSPARSGCRQTVQLGGTSRPPVETGEARKTERAAGSAAPVLAPSSSFAASEARARQRVRLVLACAARVGESAALLRFVALSLHRALPAIPKIDHFSVFVLPRAAHLPPWFCPYVLRLRTVPVLGASASREPFSQFRRSK
jgi:hypothetical protein